MVEGELKTAAVLVKNHTKALHDALKIDADTVDSHHITVAPTPPSSPTVGDLWVDTS